MSEQERMPTPEEVEKAMIEKELQEQKDLGIYAQYFQLYIHRFNNQMKFMSKKEIIRLVGSLVGSEYNDSKEVSKVLAFASKLNVNSLLRSIRNALEEGLERNKEDIKQCSKDESKFYNLLNGLLSNKYIKSIHGVNQKNPPKTIEDVVKPTHDSKEFNSRKQVEKDSYSTANMLLYTKAMMVNYTVLEYLDENATELNQIQEKKDGTDTKET